MSLPLMAFSASFDVGGVITYWIIEYRRTGLDLSSAAVTWLVLGALVFFVATVVHLRARRPTETSSQAIERQILAAVQK